MKKPATLIAFLLLATLIVLPSKCTVNYSPSNLLIVDGSPLPVPPPPSGVLGDGSPLPVPPPPGFYSA